MISCLIKELPSESNCWYQAAREEALQLSLSSQCGFLQKRFLLALTASFLISFALSCHALPEQLHLFRLFPLLFLSISFGFVYSWHEFLHLLAVEDAD